MTRPRDRILALAATAVLAAAACSCSVGPVWEPRIEGRVVDDETGEPVAGVLVAASYSFTVLAIESRHGESLQGWGYSDPDGRFVIPGRWKVDIADPFVSWSESPSLDAYHPDHGWTFDSTSALPRFQGVTVRLRSNDRTALDEDHDARSACYLESDEVCAEFCRMAFPGRESCGDPSDRRPPRL